MNDEAAKCCPPESASDPIGLASEQGVTQLATFAKALGHPVRVQILRILLGREACICGEIVAELPLAQSTVSQHLKVLRESGLVRGEVDGPSVCYCVNRSQIEILVGLVDELNHSVGLRSLSGVG